MTKRNPTLSDASRELRAAKASGDIARIRKATLGLLDAIHEKMAGVTEEEVDAAVAAARAELRERG